MSDWKAQMKGDPTGWLLEEDNPSVRYWVRHYPAFVIAGRKEYVGWDRAALDRVLQARISQQSPTA